MNFFFYVLKNIDEFVKSAEKRQKTLPANLKDLCREYTNSLSFLANMRKERNALVLSAKDVQQKTKEFALHKSLSQKILQAEKYCKDQYMALCALFFRMPNILDASVSEDAVVLAQSMEISKVSRMTEQKWNKYICKQKGAYMSGAKFAVLTTEGSAIFRKLQNILIANALKNEFFELHLPVILNRHALSNSSHMQFFEDELFEISGEDKFLVPTSEAALANFHANEVLTETKRYFCICNCFRKEAGSYGKSNFLISRLHQFSKLELFTFCDAATSAAELQKIIDTACEVLKKLHLPFRILRNAANDTSSQATITIDVEVWCPSFGWMEISSCSNVLYFQSTRSGTKIGKNYAATLNGTALACERLLLAFLDNHGDDESALKLLQ